MQLWVVLDEQLSIIHFIQLHPSVVKVLLAKLSQSILQTHPKLLQFYFKQVHELILRALNSLDLLTYL